MGSQLKERHTWIHELLLVALEFGIQGSNALIKETVFAQTCPLILFIYLFLAQVLVVPLFLDELAPCFWPGFGALVLCIDSMLVGFL